VLPSSSAGRETSAKADELYQKLLSRNKKLNGQIERHGKEYKEKTQIRAQLHKAIEEEYMRILEDDYASYKNEKVVKEFKAKHAARIIWKWYTKCKAKKREIRPESIEVKPSKPGTTKEFVSQAPKKQIAVNPEPYLPLAEAPPISILKNSKTSRSKAKPSAKANKIDPKLVEARKMMAHAKLLNWYPILVARWRGRHYHHKFISSYEPHIEAIVKLQSWFRGTIDRNKLYWTWVFAHHRKLRRNLYSAKRNLWKVVDDNEAKVIKSLCSLENERYCLEAYRTESLQKFEAKWSKYEEHIDKAIERNFNKSMTDWVKVGDMWMNAKKIISQTQSPLIEIKAKNKLKQRNKALSRLEKHFAAAGDEHGKLVEAFEAKAPAVLEEARLARCQMLNC